MGLSFSSLFDVCYPHLITSLLNSIEQECPLLYNITKSLRYFIACRYDVASVTPLFLQGNGNIELLGLTEKGLL